MNRTSSVPDADRSPGLNLDALEAKVQSRLQGRIHDLRLVSADRGLILRGRTRTYHAKQLAQHAVMEATDHPIAANEIQVV